MTLNPKIIAEYGYEITLIMSSHLKKQNIQIQLHFKKHIHTSKV